MKTESTPARRAAWLFLAAPALLVTPAQAQDATTQAPTPPPPVTTTVPQADAPAPQSSTTTVRGTDPASRTTIAPGAADVVDDARVAARPERRAAAPREVTRRTTTVTRTSAPAAATTAATATAPAATTPVAPAAAPAAQPEAATPASPAAEAPAATTSETTTTQTTPDDGAPLWPLAAIAAVIVAIGAFFLMRGRKRDAYEEEVYYEEPAHAEPVAVVEPTVVDRAPVAASAAVAPLAAAPIAAAAMSRHDEHRSDEPVAAGLAEDATVTDAPAEDVVALTAGTPAVRDRPWLELAMRPVRAGTSADEAMVEIELTVANSGSVAARDVRVSTFMLTDAHASEMENMLVDTPADAAIDPVTIEPGEGTRIDATLAALKADLGGEGRFTPVVVADARYRLPDGSEGRTSASFVVGVSDEEGGTLIPIDLADRVMRDDVEARLHGAPEHA
ncbi:hypothetical protein ACFSC3_04220 [Sphingomonas floccifaciens]|uniref:Uncharacterized protein n=1 Tax=Sphingomonas floccifaciens TaxID=1844115 RepID=A0ABW4N9W0_9SPHN